MTNHDSQSQDVGGQITPLAPTVEKDARRPVVIDITGGLLSSEERAIHARYQSDDPTADYYDPCVFPPTKGDE